MEVLIWTPGTDEDPEMRVFRTKEELMKKVKSLNLHYTSYAIVKGEVMKGFDQRGLYV